MASGRSSPRVFASLRAKRRIEPRIKRIKRIEEKQIRIGQHRLAVVQVRVPIRKETLPADIVDKARTRKRVIVDIAIEEHRGGEQDFPEHRYQTYDEQQNGTEISREAGTDRAT